MFEVLLLAQMGMVSYPRIQGQVRAQIVLYDPFEYLNKDNYIICAVFVPAPPVFIKTPPTFVEVLLGDSLTLSCGAHGNPRPTVVWHKDDSQIERHEKIKVS